MALPEINVYQVDSESIMLNWKVQDVDTVKTWNLYSSSTYNGVYTLLQSKIPNMVIRKDIAPGAVFVILKRAALGITASAPIYFKITSVSPANVESSVASSNFVAVDALDDVNRNRMADNTNPVYKNITMTVASGELNKFVDVVRILGREANYVKVTSDVSVSVKFNSANNDAVTVNPTPPFELPKGDLGVSAIYLSFVAATANVNIFVSGN